MGEKKPSVKKPRAKEDIDMDELEKVIAKRRTDRKAATLAAGEIKSTAGKPAPPAEAKKKKAIAEGAPGEEIDFGAIQEKIDKAAAGEIPDFGMMGGGSPAAMEKAEDAVETGIPGLDAVMEGGFPKKSLILLAGSCGTGKSIFGMQYLYNGAKMGEPGVLVSLEEEPEDLIKDMEKFGWDLKSLIKKGKLAVIKPEIYEFDTLKRLITDRVERLKAKRLVIDSYTLISSYFEKIYDVRKAIVNLSRDVKKLNCTTIAISDIMEGSKTYSISGFEEFMVDGVLVLSLLRAQSSGAYTRALLIRKMRNRSHSLKLIPFNIDKRSGINLYPEAEVFD